MSTRKDDPILGPYPVPRYVGVEKQSGGYPGGDWILYVGMSPGDEKPIVHLDAGFMLDLAVNIHREIIKSDKFKKYSSYPIYRDMCREMP